MGQIFFHVPAAHPIVEDAPEIEQRDNDDEGVSDIVDTHHRLKKIRDNPDNHGATAQANYIQHEE